MLSDVGNVFVSIVCCTAIHPFVQIENQHNGNNTLYSDAEYCIGCRYRTVYYENRTKDLHEMYKMKA